ncbi:MAG TPA: hypothetical protein VFA70_01065, partial [Dehalococcoidia bacterium]|nr:hypothetical protein [Dehalococcoidia bacterium]
RTLARVELAANWADIAAVVGVIVVFYLVITRRGSGATVGETLFSADYVRRLRRLSPRQLSPWQHGAEDSDSPRDTAARIFHALGDEQRLRVARALRGGARLLPEITSVTGQSATDVLADLAALERAGVVRVARGSDPPSYELDARVGVAIDSVLGGAGAGEDRVLIGAQRPSIAGDPT